MKKIFKFTPPWRGKKNKKNSGFTFVEVLVAVSIFTLSILALLVILTQGISNTNYARQKITATYLAQEGIEHGRNIRDTHVLYDGSLGWVNFLNDTRVTNYPSPNAYASFTRTIRRTVVSGDEVQISSTVSWAQASGVFSVTFSENLFNWIE